VADLEGGDDQPEVLPDGLAQRQQPDAERLYLALQRVDRGVALHHLGREVGVAAHQGEGGVGHLALGEAAHALDRLAEAAEVLAVGADGVFLHFFHPRVPQPNRPVMYSWVFGCLGAVKSWPAGATSISSPR
jgi:hypothetical protein